jgi:hypothetical protein
VISLCRKTKNFFYQPRYKASAGNWYFYEYLVFSLVFMTSSTTFSPDSFTLSYLPDQGLLIGRWLRPVALAALQAHYAALLEAAQAHGNCRHWLLDVRRRQINEPAAVQWFGEVFSPPLPALLGRPVVIAYFSMVNQDFASEDPNLWENIKQGALQGSQYRYFNQESEALAWLAQQP